MEIISIVEINKTRSRILLDTEESFVLYKGEIRMLHLKEGAALSEDDYNKIIKGILPKRCKMRALNLLKERCYTSYTLKRKLLDGGYPVSIVDDTIDYVSSFGYVNDIEYAKGYIASRQETKSRSEIKQKLLTKGISGDMADEAYRLLGEEREEFGEETDSEIEESLIRKTLSKRGYTGRESYEDKQKMLAYFYRRGFSIEMVRKIMESYE